jgi:hypothetical protein
MKIISKFKDYYDYLSGVYGVDEKLVLDRTDFTSMINILPGYSPCILSVLIADTLYEGLYHEGNFYWGKDLLKLEYVDVKRNRWLKKDPNFAYITIKGKEMRISLYPVENKECLNSLHNIPIMIVDNLISKESKYKGLLRTYSRNFNNFYDLQRGQEVSLLPNPILKDIGIQSILDPKTIWIELSAWLGKQVSKNEKQVPIGDDKIRIEAHGFDYKTSFRKM